MIVARGGSRFCEKVVYNEGCVFNSGYNIEWDMTFSGETIGSLLESLVDYHEVLLDDILIEDNILVVTSCEKQGTDRWFKPTEEEILDWKNGEQELFSVQYVYELS